MQNFHEFLNSQSKQLFIFSANQNGLQSVSQMRSKLFSILTAAAVQQVGHNNSPQGGSSKKKPQQSGKNVKQIVYLFQIKKQYFNTYVDTKT